MSIPESMREEGVVETSTPYYQDPEVMGLINSYPGRNKTVSLMLDLLKRIEKGISSAPFTNAEKKYLAGFFSSISEIRAIGDWESSFIGAFVDQVPVELREPSSDPLVEQERKAKILEIVITELQAKAGISSDVARRHAKSYLMSYS